MLILFIHQDRCGYNIYFLCKLSGGQRLPLPVISQNVTGQITCGLFLKRYRNMEQKPALVKLTQRCVIENTIANTTWYWPLHLVCSKLFMSFIRQSSCEFNGWQTLTLIYTEDFFLSISKDFYPPAELVVFLTNKKHHLFLNKWCFLAPPVGLEPTTLRLTAACSTDWAKEEYFGDPCGNRTHVNGVRGRCLNRLTNGPYWCTIRDSNPGHPD